MNLLDTPRAVSTDTFDPADFLYEEARMLDEYDLEAWLDLFSDEGRYWVPALWGQANPLDSVSIHYEDKALLKVRIMRLRHPRTENMRPSPRTLHNVSNVVVERMDDETGDCTVRSNLLYVEYRLDQQRIFPAVCRHSLRREQGTWRILLKRVDLLCCDSDAGFVRVTVPF